MASFLDSWKIIKENEGGYAPKSSTMAETYMGIDRNANPGWDGWKVIDSLKPATTAAMNLKLGQNKSVQASVIKLYTNNYWNPIKLSQIEDQQVANNLMDTSVNMGVGIAAKFLQMACNASLVENDSKTLPLVVDGLIGAKTLQLANELPGESIYNHINLLREARYRDIVSKNPAMRTWLPIWLKRLTRYNNEY